jgi:hypothetical protein
MKARRKRLKNMEAALGASGELPLRVEFYDISPDGEEIRLPGPSDDRPARKVLRVRFDYRGADGPERWKERLAEIAQEATGQKIPTQRSGTTPIDPQAPLR